MRRTSGPGRTASVGLVTIFLTCLSFTTSGAVPSFSRQSGLTCASCHTVFPQLTKFGRDFKRDGYVRTENTQGQTGHLQIDTSPPLSAMMQGSFTAVNREVPDSQNGNALLPDQMSLFYAGRVSDDLGGFMQVTYDGIDDHFSMDNLDLRFARHFGADPDELVCGLTVNNNPTVSDLWNSTPAWGYPYASSEIAPSPAAAAWIDGGFAQQVAGAGAYVVWRDRVYAEGALYRSFGIGAASPPTADSEDVIAGVMPYWRVAISRQMGEHDVEVGTYGLRAKLYPGGGQPLMGMTNRFLDTGVDAQYQWLHDIHTVTVHSTWIHEKQDRDAAFAAGDVSHPSDVLNTFRVDGTYYHDRKIGGSVAFFSTTGDRDPLLYAPDAVDGSRTGKPDSRGFLTELDFVPWYNTRLSVQYTLYSRFNGGDSDYDGSGRDAADNNTFYFNTWLMF